MTITKVTGSKVVTDEEIIKLYPIEKPLRTLVVRVKMIYIQTAILPQYAWHIL